MITKKPPATLYLLVLFMCGQISAQEIIPLDTAHWEVNAQSYVLEELDGKTAIYIQNGQITLKNRAFINGTIEFDLLLTERQSFPGVFFRQAENSAEAFFLRPHLSGKPDANQGSPIVNGIQAFQLYFGESYSVAYDYNFSDWTHVKVVVNDRQAQAYFDHSTTPHLSWRLVNDPRKGQISFGTSFAPMHFADIKIDESNTDMVNFQVKGERKPIENIVSEWQISGKFDESLLDDPDNIAKVIDDQDFKHTLPIVENIAVDVSQLHSRYDQAYPGNTVLAKIIIHSDKEQWKVMDFGYSDRAVVILNGRPIYRGNNKWRSRDYRYLGTIGFFDAVFLPLKEGKNDLILAVSEDFGGWLVTGKFEDMTGIRIE